MGSLSAEELTRALDLVKQLRAIERYEWVTCERNDCDGKPHEGMWRKHARPKQMPPDGEWFGILWLAGRGFGKSRCICETGKAWAGYSNLPNIEAMSGSRG